MYLMFQELLHRFSKIKQKCFLTHLQFLRIYLRVEENVEKGPYKNMGTSNRNVAVNTATYFHRCLIIAR